MKKEEMPICPIETALLLFGEKWKFLIIRELLPAPKRFKDLHSSISDISDRMLSVKLTALVQSGLVQRKLFAQVPPKVEYSLTELGRTLHPVFAALYDWGEMYQNLVNSGQLPIDSEE